MSEVSTIPASTLMTFIERAARDDTFNVEKFSALLSLQRDAEHEQARRAFNVAMANCQAQMEPVLRGTPNPGTRSKYAKLEDIDRQMRPVYTGHGFSVRFGSDAPPQPGWMRITCTVAHDAGYYETNYLDSPVSTVGSQGGRMAMTGVQAVGSVTTYLRRYLLGMVFNIVQADIVGEDNDGEAPPADAADAKKPAHTEPPPASTHVHGDIYDQHNIAIELLDVGDSQTWMSNLEMLLAEATSLKAVEVIGECESVKRTIEKAPGSVRARVSELLAKACKRFIENDPTIGGDELPDVEIAGERNVMAG